MKSMQGNGQLHNPLCDLFVMGIVLCTFGCLTSEGTDGAAREHLESELDKWIGGNESDASTMEGRIAGSPPISYTVKSIVPDEPDSLVLGSDRPSDWSTFPAFRANVVLAFRSQADTPLERVATYTITWNKPKKQWHISERF